MRIEDIKFYLRVGGSILILAAALFLILRLMDAFPFNPNNLGGLGVLSVGMALILGPTCGLLLMIWAKKLIRI